MTLLKSRFMVMYVTYRRDKERVERKSLQGDEMKRRDDRW